jgi:hypothetical protein
LNSEIEKEVGKLPPIRIVISYRREDTPGGAGRLRQDLGAHFGRENVFLDIDTIPPGADWVEEIEGTVSSSDVLLPVIGLHWLTVTDENGQRRLDDPNDVLRFEIETALKTRVRVFFWNRRLGLPRGRTGSRLVSEPAAGATITARTELGSVPPSEPGTGPLEA